MNSIVKPITAVKNVHDEISKRGYSIYEGNSNVPQKFVKNNFIIHVLLINYKFCFCYRPSYQEQEHTKNNFQQPAISRSRSIPRDINSKFNSSASNFDNNTNSRNNLKQKNQNNDDFINDNFLFSGANRFGNQNKTNPQAKGRRNSFNENGFFGGDMTNDNQYSNPSNMHEGKTYFNGRPGNY